jgi:TonB family protein
MKQSLLVSLIAHVLIILAMLFWPQKSLPKRTNALTIQQIIDLRQMPEPEVKPKPEPPKEIEQPKPKPRKKPDEELIKRQKLRDKLKERLKTRKPKPTPVPTKRKPKSTPTAIQKRTTPTPTSSQKIDFVKFKDVTPIQATQTPLEQPPDANVSPDQPVSFEPGFNYQGYADRLMRTLSRNWDPPAWQPKYEEGIFTQVFFIIQSDGRIVNARVERSSGWKELDDSALRAVRRSSPVEPLPSAYGRSSVKTHACFRPLRR